MIHAAGQSEQVHFTSCTYICSHPVMFCPLRLFSSRQGLHRTYSCPCGHCGMYQVDSLDMCLGLGPHGIDQLDISLEHTMDTTCEGMSGQALQEQWTHVRTHVHTHARTLKCAHTHMHACTPQHNGSVRT